MTRALTVVTRSPPLPSHLGALDAFPLYALALAVFVMGTSEFMLAGLLPRSRTTSTSRSARRSPHLGLRRRHGRGRARHGRVRARVAAASHAHRLPGALRRVPCRRRGDVCLRAPPRHARAQRPRERRVPRRRSAYGDSPRPRERTGRALAVVLSGTTIATVVGVPAGRCSAAHRAGGPPSPPSRCSVSPRSSGSSVECRRRSGARRMGSPGRHLEQPRPRRRPAGRHRPCARKSPSW